VSRDMLNIYVITEKPSDFPEHFVVRRQAIGPGGSVHWDPEAKTAPTLADARKHVPPGLIRFARAPSDDPVIVETWL
jgi:hypothetical protein